MTLDRRVCHCAAQGARHGCVPHEHDLGAMIRMSWALCAQCQRDLTADMLYPSKLPHNSSVVSQGKVPNVGIL